MDGPRILADVSDVDSHDGWHDGPDSGADDAGLCGSRSEGQCATDAHRSDCSIRHRLYHDVDHLQYGSHNCTMDS